LARAADVEGEIAKHAVARPCDLVCQSASGGRQRLGVRHLENRRDAAHHSTAAAALEILLVLEPRLAKMNLGVDHSGQDVQPSSVDDLRCLRRVEVAYGCDPAIDDADVAYPGTVLVYDGTALQYQVEHGAHCRHPWLASGLRP